MRILTTALFLALLLPAGAHAGSIRNTDAKAYKYTIHWEDLSTPETFEIGAGERRGFDERKATVVLEGQKDNIYVRPGDTILIINGVMLLDEHPAAEGR